MGMGGGLPRKCNLKLFLTWGRVLSKINDVIKKTPCKKSKRRDGKKSKFKEKQ